jgi:hypothetical protein
VSTELSESGFDTTSRPIEYDFSTMDPEAKDITSSGLGCLPFSSVGGDGEGPGLATGSGVRLGEGWDASPFAIPDFLEPAGCQSSWSREAPALCEKGSGFLMRLSFLAMRTRILLRFFSPENEINDAFTVVEWRS